MQRINYFPSVVGLRAAFFAQLAHGLPEANATLGMPAPDIASIIADCRFCEYGAGGWRIGVRNWKTNPAFPASGIKGSLHLKGTASSFDPLTFKSVLRLSIVGGQIRVDFTKGECDAVMVYCRLRGTATWTKLGYDSHSPYYDTVPLANPAVPEVREYLAVGVINEVEIGVPSDIVSIVFGG